MKTSKKRRILNILIEHALCFRDEPTTDAWKIASTIAAIGESLPRSFLAETLFRFEDERQRRRIRSVAQDDLRRYSQLMRRKNRPLRLSKKDAKKFASIGIVKVGDALKYLCTDGRLCFPEETRLNGRLVGELEKAMKVEILGQDVNPHKWRHFANSCVRCSQRKGIQ